MATPRCAGCLTPFGPGAKRIVSDTEVFHESCLGLIPQSLANRLKRKVVELNGRVKHLEIEAREAPTLRTQLSDTQRENSDLRAERDRRVREARDRARERTTQTRSDGYYQQQYELLTQENQRLARELEAARQEVLLHQTIQGQAVSPTTAPKGDQPTKPTDMWDDMEKRYSLLELDDKK
jgi:hypothetical protein